MQLVKDVYSSTRTVWRPHPGSQYLFLTCPVFEVLYEGTRGPGKTDALLMDFAQHTGQGYGENWRGVLFRETYPQLADVVAKTKRWFPAIFKGARFKGDDFTWRFPGGEELLLRHGRVEDDYWNYHGHEYPWIGFEELTNWPTLAFYESMKACSRSSHPGMPRKFRSTCNPYGVGHNAVKQHFIDPAPANVIITDPVSGMQRVRIHGSVYENTTLLAADKDYIAKLQSITNEHKRKAWLLGDWNIVAGGMLDDVWDEKRHFIEPFEIPKTWKLQRAFDWGSSRPFSVGWWAKSDGSTVTLRDGTKHTFPRGTCFRVAEWYGWNGKANEGTRMLAVEVARQIKEKEAAMFSGRQVLPGPADAAIFNIENSVCIAADMGRIGISWEPADKKPGSRIQGWEKIRQLLSNALGDELPGMFIFNTCAQWKRTVPTLARDKKNPDDVDTESEDHAGDETRYYVLGPSREAKQEDMY